MTIATRSSNRSPTRHLYRFIGAAALVALSLGAGLTLSPTGTKSAEAAGNLTFILVESAAEQQEVLAGLNGQADESIVVLLAGTPEEEVGAFEIITQTIATPGPDGRLPSFFVNDLRPVEDEGAP